MSHPRWYDADYQEYQEAMADKFRCPSCERNTGNGRMCETCKAEAEALLKRLPCCGHMKMVHTPTGCNVGMCTCRAI